MLPAVSAAAIVASVAAWRRPSIWLALVAAALNGSAAWLIWTGNAPV